MRKEEDGVLLLENSEKFHRMFDDDRCKIKVEGRNDDRRKTKEENLDNKVIVV